MMLTWDLELDLGVGVERVVGNLSPGIRPHRPATRDASHVI